MAKRKTKTDTAAFEVSFAISTEDALTVRKIVDRACRMNLCRDRLSSQMDLTATHANGCPMDFARMLAADDFNFAHDFCGIYRHLDRDTGKLMDFFLPRFSRPEAARA